MMSHAVIHLPQIPNRDMFVDNEQFFSALSAWQNVCRQVVLRSDCVEPPAMPQRDRYLSTEQFYAALNAWENIFAPVESFEW